MPRRSQWHHHPVAGGKRNYVGGARAGFGCRSALAPFRRKKNPKGHQALGDKPGGGGGERSGAGGRPRTSRSRQDLWNDIAPQLPFLGQDCPASAPVPVRSMPKPQEAAAFTCRRCFPTVLFFSRKNTCSNPCRHQAITATLAGLKCRKHAECCWALPREAGTEVNASAVVVAQGRKHGLESHPKGMMRSIYRRTYNVPRFSRHTMPVKATYITTGEGEGQRRETAVKVTVSDQPLIHLNTLRLSPSDQAQIDPDKARNNKKGIPP